MAQKVVIKVSEEQVHDACRVLYNRASEINAKTYCGAVEKHRMTGEVLYAQIPYILSNGSSLRGEGTKEAKLVLNSWFKQHSVRVGYGYKE